MSEAPREPDHGGAPSARRPDRRGAIAWFAGNHVAANMLMVFVLAAGLLTLLFIKVEVFQEIDPGLVRVSVPYPGSSPAEVEELICQRVEEAIEGIEGIKRVRSAAREGLGAAVAELEDYADDREVLDDVKQAVDRIEDFPPRDADEPSVVDVDSRIQVISLVIYGEVPLRTLKALADRVHDELTALDGISLVEISGLPPYEISIEVGEQMLRRHGLRLGDVADAVRRSSLDLPGGRIKSAGGEILIRTKGQGYVGRDYENIPLLTRSDGTRLYIRDVATVVDGFEDTDTATWFDGQPAALLKVFRVGDQDALEVERLVMDYAREQPMPAGVSLATWLNRAAYLRGRLGLLTRNAVIGWVLVLLSLALFLDLRLAFWTAVGIPISFMGAFFLMPAFGVSVNMISLFALIVVLGIVVDDAIVVGENIFEYRQRGLTGLDASIRGVREMAAPVVLTVLTTIVAFLPLLYTAGALGKILWPIPAVVVCVLSISLVEALFILPAHLATGKPRRADGAIARAQQRVRDGLRWLVEGPYLWLLQRAVRFRYLTLALGAAVLALAVGLVAGGHIKFTLMPQVDADNVWATLAMPQGTTVQETAAAVRRLEAGITRVRRAIDAERPAGAASIVRHISTTVGDQPFSAMASSGPGAAADGGGGGGHLAEVNLELLSGEERDIPSREIAQRWRDAVGELPGATSLTFTAEFFSAGEAINVELMHADFGTLLLMVERLKAALGRYAGVMEIADSFEPGKRELKLALTTAGRAAGLTLEDLARQVRQAFYGEEVQRVQRGRDDIKVMVRFPAAERRRLADIHRMRIRLPDGTAVPFGTVAHVQPSRGYAVIERVDRRRVVSVTADVDDRVANANEINEALRRDVLPVLRHDFPGMAYSFEGEQREQMESLRSLGGNMAIALLGIFVVLSVQFRSYLQPIIVMTAIPFGLVGALLGHLIMGLNLSMLSGFGAVALSGVVVNDSLIMIDLINRRRREGRPLHRVVLESGARRFRPILLTTLTTFFGLSPMIFERSLQARFLIPMAVSLGFGVLFATAITLVLVPSLYMLLEDLRTLLVPASVREREGLAEATTA